MHYGSIKRQKAQRLCDAQGGFTLVEFAVASAILLLGILVGLLPMQLTPASMSNYSEQTFTAAAIANDYLENMGMIYHPKRYDSDTNTWPTAANTDDYTSYTACTGIANDNPGTVLYFRKHKIFRKNLEYLVAWKAEPTATLSQLTAYTSLLKITVRVSWAKQKQIGAYNPYAQGPTCHFVEAVGFLTCNTGDFPATGSCS